MANFTLLQPEILQSYTLHVPEFETPLWEHWDEFVEKYLRNGRSEVTVSRVKDALRFVMKLGILTLEQMNNPRLLEETLYTYKSRGRMSNTTFNSYLKNFNTYFLWLHKRDYIATNNLSKIDRCKEDVIEQYILSENQVKLIVAHMHDRQQHPLERLRNVLFIDLLRFTGARPCELLSIQMRDIVQDGNTYKLIIRGKKQKGRPRYYRLSSAIRDSYESYKEYRSRLRQNEIYLFISCSKQGRWTEKGMRGLFKRLSQELGFRVIAYGFRRYVATKLNAHGVEMRDIQNYLGHTKATTTQRYIERSCLLTAKGAEVMGG